MNEEEKPATGDSTQDVAARVKKFLKENLSPEQPGPPFPLDGLLADMVVLEVLKKRHVEAMENLRQLQINNGQLGDYLNTLSDKLNKQLDEQLQARNTERIAGDN